jgi:hypothetical protein
MKINIQIQTETVNVRGFLTKPSLVKKDEIEFGLVQLGESNTAYIEVFNPSDEPMSIQILLAPEEFADIHNNSMFFNNKQRLFPLNNITILECNYFNISNFIDQTSQNFTQNFINNRSKKRGNPNRKKGEEDLNANSILLEEEISNNDINMRSISKTELLKKIFLYTNVNSKVNFLESERIICNTNFFKKNEIIFSNNKELIEKIFSEEFMKEINIIKRMTDRAPPSSSKAVIRENSLNFVEKIAYAMKAFFKTEVLQRKKRTQEENTNNNSNFQANGLGKQEFFLPKALTSQIFIIKPHQKTKIGPILYSPSNYSVNSTATLFIKNNLTVLYPIKLKGHGGSGVLNFFLIKKKNSNLNENKNNIQNNQNKKLIEILSEEKFEKLIINIDSLEEIESNNGEIVKEIKIKNTGNLPVKVSNLTIKDASCEGYGIKLSKCDGFLLNPQEHINLAISIFPDFNFYYSEKEILFETLHQTINIKILIRISEEILAQKNKLLSFNNFKGYGSLSFGVSSLIILIIVFIMKKEESKKEAAKAADEDKDNKFISFISAKEIIEKNNLLKFENLFMKAYRKNNRGFYEEFLSKHLDTPTKHEVENLISDKRKKNLASSNNKINNAESGKDKSDEAEDKNDNYNYNDNNIRSSNEINSASEKKSKNNIEKSSSKEIAGNENEAKEIQKVKGKGVPEAAPKTIGKKSNLNNKEAKSAIVNTVNSKKNLPKKPYGIAIKGQDSAQSTSHLNLVNNSIINNKKDENEKKTLHNILNSNNISTNFNSIVNNNNNYNSNISSQSLLPGSIYQTGGKYDKQASSQQTKMNLPIGKEDLANLQPEYYTNQMNANWVDPAFYPAAAMGFWPKNYPTAGNSANLNRLPANPNFEGFAVQSAKMPFSSSFGSYSVLDNDNKSSINCNYNNPNFVSNGSNLLNQEAPNFSIDEAAKSLSAVNNNSNKNTSYSRKDSKEEKSKSSSDNIDNFNNQNIEENVNANNNIKKKKAADFTNNFSSFTFQRNTSEAPSKTSGIPNIKEQFMSFVPGFFTQNAYNNNNNNKNNDSAASNFLSMNFIAPARENESSSSVPKTKQKENFSSKPTNSQENKDDLDIKQIDRISHHNLKSAEGAPVASQTSDADSNLIGNFKMIDFTNYFNNNNNNNQNDNEEVAGSVLGITNKFEFGENNFINNNNNNEDNSDNEDLNNLKDNDEGSAFNENEYDNNKYRSDREKLIEDSGTEERESEIKFNFNSIFGQNNMKLISNPSYNDFGIQESEEPKQNFDGNKPYFDKNLFFSFDSVFNTGSKATSSFFNNGSTNLFSANTKSTNLLSELRDDDHEENNNNNGLKPGDKWDSGRNRIDDVADIEDDEDDEEDPEWNNEDVDVKKEGFFDPSGNYKLKQIDFNFNLDFNARK